MSVQLSRQGACALLMLDRPEALNALTFATLLEIGNALDEVAEWPVRALIIAGAGQRAFCAGADVEELRNRSLLEQRRGLELGHNVFTKLDRLPIASIAAIEGFALGGGLELALACTFRLASPTAKLGLPEIKLGLIPGYGGTQRLPRLIGEARALEMIMTGRAVSAPEAERMGLVNRIVEGDVIEAAVKFAQEFTGHSLPTLMLARQAVSRALGLPLQEGLRVETDLSTLAYRSCDAEEGLSAFVEKRPPAFRDV